MAIQNIGRYRILRELGRGATATVYLARDPGSGRQVAVKILAAAFTAAPDFSDRFGQTLAALVSLEHPYLVSPHDYGRDGDQFFVVMRYLPGGTLADRMDGRPMLLAEVVPILQRLAEALDAAHTAHLLHGDLHPADVLFDLHERGFLADLGLAQLLDPVAGPSPTGTAAYMSPEQIAGQAIDGRADVYALGILVFEMLTGRQPFSGDTPQEMLRQHVEQPVPQLSAAVLSHLVLPLEFNLVIARALAKNRDHRYPTASVLAEAMRTMFLMSPADSAETAPAPVEPPPNEPPQLPLPLPPIMAAAPPPRADATPGAASAAVPVPPPAAKPALESDSFTPAPTPAELVREPEPPPRRGPARILLGLAGLGLVLAFLAIWRWPDIRAAIVPPTATATSTSTSTLTPTVAPTSTPPTTLTSTTAPATATATPTASPSQTSTTTATASDTATVTPAPTDTPTATHTPTRRPTLPTFTATPAPAQASVVSFPTDRPTQTHLGPPPTRTP